MTKTLYILTGWGERLSDDNYKTLISSCPKYKVKKVKLTTRNPKLCLGAKSLEKTLEDLQSQIKNPHTIVGFSTGALLAYLFARYVQRPENLILCSLPPLLEKDGNKEKDLTKEQKNTLKIIDYVAPPIKHKIFYGENEDELLKERNSLLGGKEIKNASHKLEGVYLKRVIGELNL